jgi:hypothetical protein
MANSKEESDAFKIKKPWEIKGKEKPESPIKGRLKRKKEPKAPLEEAPADPSETQVPERYELAPAETVPEAEPPSADAKSSTLMGRMFQEAPEEETPGAEGANKGLLDDAMAKFIKFIEEQPAVPGEPAEDPNKLTYSTIFEDAEKKLAKPSPKPSPEPAILEDHRAEQDMAGRASAEMPADEEDSEPSLEPVDSFLAQFIGQTSSEDDVRPERISSDPEELPAFIGLEDDEADVLVCESDESDDTEFFYEDSGFTDDTLDDDFDFDDVPTEVDTLDGSASPAGEAASVPDSTDEPVPTVVIRSRKGIFSRMYQSLADYFHKDKAIERGLRAQADKSMDTIVESAGQPKKAKKKGLFKQLYDRLSRKSKDEPLHIDASDKTALPLLILATGGKAVVNEQNKAVWEKILEDADYDSEIDANRKDFRDTAFAAYESAKGEEFKNKDVLIYVLSELAEASSVKGNFEKAVDYAMKAYQLGESQLFEEKTTESLRKWGVLDHNVEVYKSKLEQTVGAE